MWQKRFCPVVRVIDFIGGGAVAGPHGKHVLYGLDEFRATLVEMGIEEVIQIYGKNYEIYLEKGAPR